MCLHYLHLGQDQFVIVKRRQNAWNNSTYKQLFQNVEQYNVEPKEVDIGIFVNLL